MIEYVKGDIFESGCFVGVNTVNCKGVMGKGIAKEFKERYPEMFKQYKNDCKHGFFKPGNIKVYYHPRAFLSVGPRGCDINEFDIIVCMATKDDWRYPSKVEWVENCVKQLRDFIKINFENNCTFAMTKPGCGNGKLNWETQVKPIVEKYLSDLKQTIYIYDKAAS